MGAWHASQVRSGARRSASRPELSPKNPCPDEKWCSRRPLVCYVRGLVGAGPTVSCCFPFPCDNGGGCCPTPPRRTAPRAPQAILNHRRPKSSVNTTEKALNYAPKLPLTFSSSSNEWRRVRAVASGGSIRPLTGSGVMRANDFSPCIARSSSPIQLTQLIRSCLGNSASTRAGFRRLSTPSKLESLEQFERGSPTSRLLFCIHEPAVSWQAWRWRPTQDPGNEA